MTRRSADDDLKDAREAHYVQRDAERAFEAYERAATTAERSNDLRGAANALFGLATLRLEQGWIADASAFLSDARDRATRAKAEDLIVLFQIAAAEVFFRSGDLDAARDGFEEALESATRTGHHLGLALLSSARIAQEEGDYTRAKATMEKARALLEGDPRRLTMLRVRSAVLALEDDDTRQAVDLLAEARAQASAVEGMKLDPFVLREMWLYSAMALALLGDDGEARKALEEARSFRGGGAAARHFRHVMGLTQTLVDVIAQKEDKLKQEVIARARQELQAVRAPGPDGVSAVNCFYVVRVAARLLDRAIGSVEADARSSRTTIEPVIWPPSSSATSESARSVIEVLDEVASSAMSILITSLLDTEADLYVSKHARRGEADVARHGRARPRAVPVASLQVTIAAPRVRDRRPHQSMQSRILPPNRPPALGGAHRLVAAILRGFITGDFTEVRTRLGAITPALEGIDTAIDAVQTERSAWQGRALTDLKVARLLGAIVPVVHDDAASSATMKSQTALLVIGILPSNKKQLLAATIGDTHSLDDWQSLITNVTQRGLTRPDQIDPSSPSLLFDVSRRAFR